MARNLEYEHGYRMGYEHHISFGGTLEDAKKEIILRFGRRALYSPYGHGFLDGFKDHRDGKPQRY
jgi:hypothetical protein